MRGGAGNSLSMSLCVVTLRLGFCGQSPQTLAVLVMKTLHVRFVAEEGAGVVKTNVKVVVTMNLRA